MASTISAGTTAGTAIAIAGDTSGELQLRTNGTTTALTIGTNQNATFAGYVNAPNTFGFKNRIINGAMVIDQRNAGASVTPTSTAYTLDRWQCEISQASKVSVQQNAGSVTPPTGFTNYLGVTSLSAYSVLTNDFFTIQQFIEGFNTADLGFGTANAKTITISFWVRSSLTGTFGGCLANYTLDRSYPFTYSISSANTWEQKSVTIAGDTTGTWNTTNSGSLFLQFSLGAGSGQVGTAGAWAAAGRRGATGQTSVVGTNGATFYITGVQLEVGSTATSFDYRPYGTELALCQRYCFVISGTSTFSTAYARWMGIGNGTNQFIWLPQFPVQMRTIPTLISSAFTSTNVECYNYTTSATPVLSSISLGESDVWHAQMTLFCNSNISTGQQVSWRWIGNPSAYVGFTAEL